MDSFVALIVMKSKNLHRTLIFSLLLLAGSILLSSIGSFYHKSENLVSIETKKTAENKKQEEKVSTNYGLEAVVVSVSHLDFHKEVLFLKPEIVFVFQKAIITTCGSIFLEKYFNTLFTHIISPNAP